jgi:hypothetical protein
MSDTFNELGALRCGAPGVGDGTPVEEVSEEEAPSTEYFTLCYNALFDVSNFASKVLEGEEHNFLCDEASILEIRRAFAFAPDALAQVTLAFQDTLEENAGWERQRLNLLLGPLPPVNPSQQAQA